jgi:hypothetical protein
VPGAEHEVDRCGVGALRLDGVTVVAGCGLGACATRGSTAAVAEVVVVEELRVDEGGLGDVVAGLAEEARVDLRGLVVDRAVGELRVGELLRRNPAALRRALASSGSKDRYFALSPKSEPSGSSQ